MTKPIYKITVDENTKISISEGNTKMGKTPMFNTLPGSSPLTKKDGTLITDIPGTCTGVCQYCENGGCYAINGARYHHNSVVPSIGKNTLMMRQYPDKVFDQIKQYVEKKRPKSFRFHSSGEIENYDYLLRMDDLAAECPYTQFYVYTKRFDFVQKYLEERGVRSNLVINISEWKDNTKGYNFEQLNKFIWDDGTDPEIAKLKHCPGVSKPEKKGGKGHMTDVHCDKCGLCFRKNAGLRIAVYNH